MAEPFIIDPLEPSGIRPTGGGGDGGIEILNDPNDVGTYDDIDPLDTRGAGRPSVLQRMSSLSIHGRDRDRRESRSNTKAKRDSVISKPSDKYVFYRFEKDGDDWQYARRRKLPASQSDMEKQVRKWRGSVLQETKRMGDLRSQQLQRLVDDANAEEDDDRTWETVWLESQKVSTGTRVECKRMDVILARSNKAKPRSRSGVGEIIDVLEPSKSNSKDKDRDRDKDKDKDKKKDKGRDGDREHKRKDSVLDDPFQESVLFHRSGKPMDDRGPIEFSNAGLPPEIPRDRPIGYRPEQEKDDKDRKGKRGKSKDRGDDDAIVRVDEHLADGPGDSIEDILRNEPRAGSRAGEPFEPIEFEPGRSRSRRRPSQRRASGRSASRPRSGSRGDSIRFPPSYYAHQYMGDGGSDAVSSESSGESRYGLDREERSSYTSQDTFHDMTGRGTHYNDGGGPKYYTDKHGERRYYKEHHRGPSMSRSRGPSVSRGGGGGTPKYYPGEGGPEYEVGGRRRSRAYYAEPIPESRQIEYFDHPRESGTLVRRATYDSAYDRAPPLRNRDVKLHYPSDMVDLKERDREWYAESYQRNSVKDEFMDRQERDINRREARMDELEDQDRRRRYSRYDDDYGRSGGYYH